MVISVFQLDKGIMTFFHAIICTYVLPLNPQQAFCSFRAGTFAMPSSSPSSSTVPRCLEIVCFASGRSKLLVTTGVFGRAAFRDEGLDIAASGGEHTSR